MKRTVVVTETSTYFIEFEAPEGATEDEIEDAAREEWETNSWRKPDDYECSIEVQGERHEDQ